jgi:hypothetical protein
MQLRKIYPTEAQIEALTEALTESQIEAQTEAQTESKPESLTEAQTESPTEALTEAHFRNRAMCFSVVLGGDILNGLTGLQANL